MSDLPKCPVVSQEGQCTLSQWHEGPHITSRSEPFQITYTQSEVDALLQSATERKHVNDESVFQRGVRAANEMMETHITTPPTIQPCECAICKRTTHQLAEAIAGILKRCAEAQAREGETKP